jgi:hypothetical protein
MSDTMGATSAQGVPIPSGAATATAAPGATAPGGTMSMTNAVITTIGVAAGGLIVLGLIFRKGQKVLPPLRVDAANAINIYFSWLLIDGTLKLVAYRFHGHKVAQAYLLIA